MIATGHPSTILSQISVHLLEGPRFLSWDLVWVTLRVHFKCLLGTKNAYPCFRPDSRYQLDALFPLACQEKLASAYMLTVCS